MFNNDNMKADVREFQKKAQFIDKSGIAKDFSSEPKY